MPHHSITIGISGGSGSGKSWFARRIQDAFPGKSTLIEQDWYYRDLSKLPIEEARDTNFDHPDAIEFPLLLKHLEALQRGEVVQAPQYRFSNYQRTENVRTLQPSAILIIEGLFVLHETDVRKLLDRKLFIETAPQTRFDRRLERDVQGRGYSREHISQSWKRHAEPMFEQFVAPSAIHADQVWNPLEDNAFENDFMADLRSQTANDGNKNHRL